MREDNYFDATLKANRKFVMINKIKNKYCNV